MNSSSVHNSNLGPLNDTNSGVGGGGGKCGDNVNSNENKNNHSSGNGMGNSVRASTVYDICHPLVM